MTVQPPGPALLTLLALEREARHAQSETGLGFVLVNRTRVLVPCRQAAALRWTVDQDPKVVAISDVPAPDANAPMVRWVQDCGRALAGREDARRIHAVEPDQLPEPLRAQWSEWAPAALLWVPLARPDGQPVGALLLARDEPFSAEEAVLLDRLADTYAHAWDALAGRRRVWPAWVRNRRIWAGAAAVVALLFLLPVRQSALAPAVIAAAEPFVVAAPLDGVVSRFFVRPNENVAEGQLLLAIDDTALRARHQVAAEELAVAQAELRKAEQGALSSLEDGARVAMARAQAELKAAELAMAADMLARVEVRAERAGLALFRSVNDWIGRPVRTGERILTLADPARVEVEAHLPVADAIVLEPGHSMVVFLDSRPLDPVSAVLADASYDAAPTEEGILAYRVRGTLADGQAPPRIGLRGIARIDGSRVPLFLYLFRRPIAAARHALGL